MKLSGLLNLFWENLLTAKNQTCQIQNHKVQVYLFLKVFLLMFFETTRREQCFCFWSQSDVNKMINLHAHSSHRSLSLFSAVCQLHSLNDDTCLWYQAPSISDFEMQWHNKKKFVNGKFDKFWFDDVGYDLKSVPDLFSSLFYKIMYANEQDDTCTKLLLLLKTFTMNIFIL